MKFLRYFFLSITCFLLTSNAVFAQEMFFDIADSPYKESIVRLAELGVINGYPDSSFRPFNPVNRAEMLKIVFGYLEQDEQGYGNNCFADVRDEWFAPYVCRAKDLGIVSGYEGNLFRPGEGAKMVEAMKIIVKAFDLPVDELKSGENWYIPYMQFVHRNNLLSKYSYLPGRPARREEIAFLVDKISQIQRQETYVSAERYAGSAGCGLDQPAVVPTKFMVRGVERSAIVVIPDNYDSNEQVSLVFAFHGRTNSNERVRSYYGIEKADFNKAIFVYPAGIQTASGFSWSAGGDKADNLRDYELFDAILGEISRNYCVNMDEIYAVGHSLGGWFTNSLACARGSVLRGVASLGGARTSGTCTGPVAVMQWHNPKDELASFSSGEAARDSFLKQNQCSNVSIPVEPSSGNCVMYQGCGDFAPVVWCPHTNDYDSRDEYYTHNWPNFAGREMMRFLKQLL